MQDSNNYRKKKELRQALEIVKPDSEKYSGYMGFVERLRHHQKIKIRFSGKIKQKNKIARQFLRHRKSKKAQRVRDIKEKFQKRPYSAFKVIRCQGHGSKELQMDGFDSFRSRQYLNQRLQRTASKDLKFLKPT